MQTSHLHFLWLTFWLYYNNTQPYWNGTRVAIAMLILFFLTVFSLVAWRYRSVVRLNRVLAETLSQNARLFEQERMQRERAETLAAENARLYEQARQDAETKAILLHEVNHRVKNNLATIIGLLYAEQRHAGMEKQAAYQGIIADLINRTQGLATVHAMLSESEWAPLRLSELAERVIEAVVQALPYGKEVTVVISPSPIKVTSKQANHLALIINELATNTVKYVLVDRPAARIDVSIAQEDDQILFELRDNGRGYPEDVLRLERHNVGMYLIQAITRNDLGGKLELRNDNGAVTTIRFPVE